METSSELDYDCVSASLCRHGTDKMTPLSLRGDYSASSFIVFHQYSKVVKSYVSIVAKC